MKLAPDEHWPREEFCGRCRLPIQRPGQWHPTEAACRGALMAKIVALERELLEAR